jgi:uncharacterized protein (TIGR02466 family)
MMTADGNGTLTATLDLAWRLHRAGDLVAARRLYAGLLERAPDMPDVLHRLGVLTFQEGDAAAALDLLDRATRIRPDHPGQLRHRGAVLLALGRGGDAAQSFRQALALEPDDPETVFNLGLTERQLGRLDIAIPLLEEVAASELGSLALVRYELALARQLAGQREAAIAGYRRVLEVEPGHVNALNNLGVLLLESGDLEGAAAACRSALDSRPDFVLALNNLSSVLMEQGDLAAAVGVLERTLALTPDFAEAWNTLGTVRRGLGEDEAAIAAYRTAIRHQPLLAVAHDNLAECLRDLGRGEEALEASRAVVAAWPEDRRALHIHGDALKRAGDLEGAAALYRTALTLDDRDAESHFRLGAILALAGAVTEGTGHLERATTLQPCEPLYLRELAAALLHQGRGETAVAICDRALALDRFDQEALAYRALGLRMAGLNAEADHLTDLERWIHITAPVLPFDAAGLQAFNRALAADLRALTSRKWQPATQSIRGGTQTQANIFIEPIETIQTLHRGIDDAVRAHLATLQADPGHPFLAGRPSRYAYRGWSVILEDRGYHISHIHPEGWLSGCYYVEIPDFEGSDLEDPGCIEFGWPWTDLPFPVPPPLRRVAPAPGRLVLFPSYFWHRVRPFRSSRQRITVPFDLVPLER